MLNRVDILKELERERENNHAEENLIIEANKILEEEQIANARILNGLRGTGLPLNFPEATQLDSERIFSIHEIRTICVRYRMRFLNSKYFKGEIPNEAFIQIREIERNAGTSLNHFLIMAPKRLFQLEDADADPMMFIPLANGTYYLIHKWGMDMKWHRRMLAYPFQSIENLIRSIIVLAAIVALLTPNSLIVPESNFAYNGIFSYWGFHRISFFLHILILFSALTVFSLFAFHHNLSDSEWNRKTFN